MPGNLGESQFQQYRLKDWRDFPAISRESGVGTYTASTVLDDGWRADEGDGLWLNLGRVDGTAAIWVNGQFVGSAGGQRAPLGCHGAPPYGHEHG